VDYVREYNLASRSKGSIPRNSKGTQLSNITDFLKERGILNQNKSNSGLVYQGAKRFEKRTEKPYCNKEMIKMNYNTSSGNSANAGVSRNEKYYINKQDYVQLPSKTKELMKISAAKLRS